MAEHHSKVRAWVVTVDMGYGHQRATYPLHDIAHGGIITANTYRGIPQSDRALWQRSQRFYEAISRFKKVPVVGGKAFALYDYFQQIEPLYPKRDLSDPTITVDHIDRMIRKGWGRYLIERLNTRRLPLVTSFFATALMADIYGYPGDIYCIICDADFSRSWVAKDPKGSRIRYFASNTRVVERLKLYGVAPERIYFTGFPLPKENIGSVDHEILREDLRQRLPNVDPNRRYIEHYREMIREHLGRGVPQRSNHPLTITFAVGGAGAQLDLSITILKSLKHELEDGSMRFNVVAGVRKEVREELVKAARSLRLKRALGRSISVLYTTNKLEYFRRFNALLHTTDVLWTKPSELCFYAALGIPIIMAPTIGSQEEFNKLWLKTLGAGIAQQDPRYTNEWLKDWLHSGWLARAAWNGFSEAPVNGTYLIEHIIAGVREKLPTPALVT